jgi:hypothetical protein
MLRKRRGTTDSILPVTSNSLSSPSPYNTRRGDDGRGNYNRRGKTSRFNLLRIIAILVSCVCVLILITSFYPKQSGNRTSNSNSIERERERGRQSSHKRHRNRNLQKNKKERTGTSTSTSTSRGQVQNTNTNTNINKVKVPTTQTQPTQKQKKKNTPKQKKISKQEQHQDRTKSDNLVLSSEEKMKDNAFQENEIIIDQNSIPLIDKSQITSKDEHQTQTKTQSTNNQDEDISSSKDKVQNEKKILCPDNKTQAILNDDYCDCPDGSDEPKTSACSNILVQQSSFVCADGKSTIHASRVNDGVQDCNDGSDELLSSKK